MPFLTAYFPVLAYGILGKIRLFVAPPLEIALLGLQPELEQVVPIYSLSVAVLPTAKHRPDLNIRSTNELMRRPSLESTRKQLKAYALIIWWYLKYLGT